ncbi:oligosaccharide flippase family protein [Amphritea japonica]|uniref:Polysaccharide biosynthesis protein C-terminal domain-containing protein n=1 Tax=Amphritea japonica ATCC BAA-1530 TaxID=1278309 RepID=A0A7R6SSA6_9GAMM|nr:oligosaccharide flippase family protein [Amphritea japonica]BBB25455.1 hypothetical protein AMJAP_0856 [Amphritea japonica ATCC BAA-1530]
MKDILSKVSASFFLKIISAGLAYPIAILLARQLGTDGYGVYGFVLAVVGVLIYLVVFGFDQLVVKNANHINVPDGGNGTYPILSFAFIVIFCLSLLVWASFYASSFFIDSIEDLKLEIMIGLLILPIFASRRIFTSYLRGVGNPVVAIVPEALIQPLIMLTLVLLSYLLGIGLGADLALLFQLTAYACSVMFIGFICVSRYKLVPTPVKEFRQVIRFGFKEGLLISGFYMAIMATAEGFAMYIDRIMLGIFSSLGDVGIYLVAARNTSFVLFVESAFLLVTMPLISKGYSSGQDLKKIISLQTLLVFLAVTVFVVFFFIFGEWLVALFGEGFHDSYKPLVLLSLGYLIGALFGAGPHILMMTGCEKPASIILLFSTVLNVILNLALIPIYGIMGAAVATVVSEILKKSLAYYKLKSLTGIDSSLLTVRYIINRESLRYLWK